MQKYFIASFFSMGFNLKLLIILFCFVLKAVPIYGQMEREKATTDIRVKTTGRLVKANKLIFIVEIEIPENWKLKVEEGFEGMYEDDIDTVELAVKFRPAPGFRLVQRLKADRKPSPKGFYYKTIVFAQTIAIDTSKLPLNIDAKLKWAMKTLDEKSFAKGGSCCLLQVCKKPKNVKTLSVGWDCDRRNKVYLADLN